MRYVFSVIDALSEYSGRIFSYLSIPVVFIIMAEVVGRYFFNRPLLWSHEAMTYISAFIYLMGGAYVLKRRAHISVDLIHRRFSPRGRAIMDLFAFIFFLIFMYTLLRTSYSFAMRSINILERSGTPWNPIIYPVKAGVLVAAVLVFLAGIANFFRDLKVAITGKEEDEVS